jgi:hypothetical protein
MQRRPLGGCCERSRRLLVPFPSLLPPVPGVTASPLFLSSTFIRRDGLKPSPLLPASLPAPQMRAGSASQLRNWPVPAPPFSRTLPGAPGRPTHERLVGHRFAQSRRLSSFLTQPPW